MIFSPAAPLPLSVHDRANNIDTAIPISAPTDVEDFETTEYAEYAEYTEVKNERPLRLLP